MFFKYHRDKTLLRNTSLILLFLFLVNRANCQCNTKNSVYQSGEEIEYEVYYNWGFIWLNAGWARFKVNEDVFRGRKVYHFDSYGSSHESYDWLFKVRDHYHSYVDIETLHPIYFHRVNYEGGYEVDNSYLFDWDKNVIYSDVWNSKTPRKKDTVLMPDCTNDLLSMIYYTRNLNFDSLQVGEKVPLISIIDNEIFNLYIRYLGKDEVKHKDGTRYSCIKFSVLLVEGTIFKGGEDMFVWVTDDKNRIPVVVEAKILIGSVKAYIKNTKGLRH